MLPFGGFDPSKLKPETLAKLTELIRELPPAQIQKMQTLMHNSMAGFDVKNEAEAFEKALPPGFREKMARLMYEIHGALPTEPAPAVVETTPSTPPSNLNEARLTILRSVAQGQMSPEAACEVLFPGE